MRIIPKNTKVRIEFFKGVELLDVLVGAVGVAIDMALFVSNMPFKMVAIGVVSVIFAGLILPFEDNGDKAYMFVFHLLTNVSRYKLFRRGAALAWEGAAPGTGALTRPGALAEPEVVTQAEAAPRTEAFRVPVSLDAFELDPDPEPETESEPALAEGPDFGEAEEVAGAGPEEAAGLSRSARNGKSKDKKAKAPKVKAVKTKPAKVKADKAKPARKSKVSGTATQKHKGVPTVADITPFTGIDGEYIEYGGSYYGMAIEIPSIEFRFLTLNRQNNIIDRNLGAALRTVSEGGAAALVKIDRPIIYDDFVTAEEEKLNGMETALENGLINEAEFTTRESVIYARMDDIESINVDKKVYRPFHYLVFFEKTKDLVRERVQNALAQLENADMLCHSLNEKELVAFLKYNYTVDFDEREVQALPKERYMDWILPQKIEFAGRTVKYDDLVTHTLMLTDYPTEVANAWGHGLFNILSTRVVMKIKPVDRYKAIRRIDRAIDELRTQESSTAKTSKLIEISSHIQTLSELLFLLQGDNERLFDVNTFVTVYDYPQTRALKEQAEGKKVTLPGLQLKQSVKRQLAEQNFKTTDLFLRQFHAYGSSHVSAFDAFNIQSRSIHSGSVAAAFPFVYKTLSDKGGIRVGYNGAIPVFINFFQRDRMRVNSNMVIIGKSGSGKSYATKTLLTNLASEDSKVFILDPENEYGVLAENMRGKVIDVGNATQGRLNPFHIITTADDDEDVPDDITSRGSNVSFSTHLQFLEEFFRQILPGIEPDAVEYLNNLLVRLYEDKNIDRDSDLSKLKPSDYPTFDDLYDKILSEYQMVSGTYSKANLQVLLNYISKFSTGGRNSALWNGEATISTNENFIVFNFQSLLANKNNTVANAQMLLVLKWLDNEIIKNRDYNTRTGANRRIVITIDEAHVFIDEKFPVALDFMFQLAKRIRKYNGMQIVITQNIKDFVGTEEIARKSTAIINACQYSFIFPLAPNDMHDLVRLYEKAGAINESEQEEIVNNGRGRAFVVTSASERTSVDIAATRQVQRLFEQRGA
ncbi:MAG: ATP-binding protein [Peptococcaceae bacterium]|jgi:hypothetical protein|nr:ATP-binding protein [Peptococcaceae bacterium]